jgi:cobalt-zinc-cadmium efflux system protein
MGAHHHSHHDHHHDHHHGPARSFNRSFAIAIILTFGYVIAEGIYGILAHSMSLLADAAHNLGDSLGLILAWLANWLMSLPARKRFSYGFKRTSILAALFNAFILVATTAVIAYESIYKLWHLSTVNEDIIIVIGLIGIGVNLGSSLLFKQHDHDLNIQSAFWHLLADALILVGVVISAVAIKYTGWVWLDPVVGLIIVGIVLWGTTGLLRNSVRLILDAVPHYVDYNGVRQYLASLPGVKAVHDLHVWGLSTREVALTAHLVMPNKTLANSDYKKINSELLERFKIHHVTIQVESGTDEVDCGLSGAC